LLGWAKDIGFVGGAEREMTIVELQTAFKVLIKRLLEATGEGRLIISRDELVEQRPRQDYRARRLENGDIEIWYERDDSECQ